MTIKGSVDQLSTKGASGWIYAANEHRPIVVEAVLHHRVIGESLADTYRHDLAEVGFGDGRCGFTLEFGMPIEAAYLPFVTFRPSGGDVELPRTSLSGFSDYLAQLYATMPTTGRQRSVYGGLWTDRTDALAMLHGRRTIGHVPDAVSAAVERFIVYGHAVLEHSGAWPDGLNADGFDDMERTLAPTFFQSPLQDFLTTILDDVPVVTAGRVLREMQRDFRQPGTGHALSSPLECVALIASTGHQPSSIELIRDSHSFPDFTRNGDPRWLLPIGDAALAHAASVGSSVETLTLRANQVAIIAAGKIYRVLHPSADGTTEALCVPRRQLPVRTGQARPYRRLANFVGKLALVDAA